MRQKWPSSGKQTTVSIKQTPKLPGDCVRGLPGTSFVVFLLDCFHLWDFFSPLKSKLIIQKTNKPFYLILNVFLILCEYVFYEHLSVVGDVVDMLKVLKVLRNDVTSPAFALCDHESNVCSQCNSETCLYFFILCCQCNCEWILLLIKCFKNTM